MNFLAELEQLRFKTPRLYNINIGSQNSDYCTHADKDKNCYLIFAANFSEDCMYGGLVVSSRDCVDCSYCDHGELCYECSDLDRCYNCDFCREIKNCSDCTMCYDCIGCKYCFGCSGLRNQEYYLFNKQLPKEEYLKRVSEFDLKNKEDFARAAGLSKDAEMKIPHRALHMLQSQNCMGDYIVKSKNCFFCYDIHECEDCVYMKDCWQTKDSMDIVFSAGSELCYESFSIGLNTYNCNFCDFIRTCSDCEYSELLFNCKHCFGCIGLQSKEFYILNKPYSREEYFKKVTEIKAEMKADGSYGKHLKTTYKYEDTATAD